MKFIYEWRHKNSRTDGRLTYDQIIAEQLNCSPIILYLHDNHLPDASKKTHLILQEIVILAGWTPDEFYNETMRHLDEDRKDG